MKRGKKVFLTVLAAVALLIAALCWQQRGNIAAVVKMLGSSDGEIEAEINVAKKELEEELTREYPTIVSDFSAEEEAQIIKGTLEVEDAVEIIKKKYDDKKTDIKNKANVSEAPELKNEAIDELIGDKVIELYSLKAYYLGQLGQMEAAVKKEYAALPQEQKNLIGKKELVSKYLGTATALLNGCDTKVEELLAELRTELSRLDGDTSVADTLKAAYEKEKELKKAYYLKLLNG